jgi:endonuclease/exonuclease/phosphatase family metal-dependent hydrolase
MRFVLYNIRYAAGTGINFHFPFPFVGYLRRNRRILEEITRFLGTIDPDIIGLIEVDDGSYRSKKQNQARTIADTLGFEHVYRRKYDEKTLPAKMPLLREQGNALITNQTIEAQGFHYFQHGIKRLVLELETEAFVIFLVHLSVKYRHRQYQLGDLYTLFKEVKKPAIVAGDFNVFWGERELELFLAATGLRSANTDRRPTFPSYAPRQEFDFILYSEGIQVNRFQIPPVTWSDHMPLVCDFEVR